MRIGWHRGRGAVVSIAVVLAAASLAPLAAEPAPAADAAVPLTEPPLAADAPLTPPDAPAAEKDPVFPRPRILEPNIRFWRDVFSKWSLGQVVVHDIDHPGVIYDVVALPGEIDEKYTDEQRDFVDALREQWEDRLAALEARIGAGEPLDDEDTLLALRITTDGGSEAIDGARRRVRTQRGLRERFRRGLEIGAKYEALLREVFREAGLPEDLALLPHVESSFQWHARSKAGALGAWQFTRGTGRKYLRISSILDERLDPVIAGQGAARYLRDAYDQLGNWALAITAYNHGIQGMSRARHRHGDDFETVYREYDGRSFGFASKNFYAEFLAAREIAKDPEAFFPEELSLEPVLDHDRVELDRPTSPGRLSRMYQIPLDELAALNPAWSERAVHRGLALPTGAQVWLPAGVSTRAVDAGDATGMTHVVERGDTLWSIAEMYETTLDQLRSLNGMGSRESRIFPGQLIRVTEGGEVPAEGVVHVVRRGDTLGKIASAYGIRLVELLVHNSLTTHTVIHPGQQIRIPNPTR